MWKVLMKQVDSGEPTSFLDHVYLECTQRQCEISKENVINKLFTEILLHVAEASTCVQSCQLVKTRIQYEGDTCARTDLLHELRTVTPVYDMVPERVGVQGVKRRRKFCSVS